jgi:hypothetical protein
MDLLTQYMNVIIAALVILAVLLLALMMWRTFGGNVRGRRGQRLGISEYHEIDKMRRLVLVRRDNVEHLILIGGPQDLLIEPRIGPVGMSSFGEGAEEPGKPIAMRPAPRAPGFGERRPPPLRPVERDEPPLAPPRRDPDR